MPPEEYSPAVLKELAPPEILSLLTPVVVSDYTTLPASMQTAAYDIHTIPRFKYPCALPAVSLRRSVQISFAP